MHSLGSHLISDSLRERLKARLLPLVVDAHLNGLRNAASFQILRAGVQTLDDKI